MNLVWCMLHRFLLNWIKTLQLRSFQSCTLLVKTELGGCKELSTGLHTNLNLGSFGSYVNSRPRETYNAPASLAGTLRWHYGGWRTCGHRLKLKLPRVNKQWRELPRVAARCRTAWREFADHLPVELYICRAVSPLGCSIYFSLLTCFFCRSKLMIHTTGILRWSSHGLASMRLETKCWCSPPMHRVWGRLRTQLALYRIRTSKLEI